MPLGELRAEDFRCLKRIAFEADPNLNLIYGANASGKTSVLEAIACLGRGRSFRGAPLQNLVRRGASEFVVFGHVFVQGKRRSIGVRGRGGGVEVRLDQADYGAAELAKAFPLQVIDPDVHALVAGGPDTRRRYIDWLAFHVEHGFLDDWRRFRRALKQRNAALKAGRGVSAWTAEFVELGARVDGHRKRALEGCLAKIGVHSESLLGAGLSFRYQEGWNGAKGLGAAVEESLERDLALGSTQVGPHRADLKLIADDREARRFVSRGQQKLLACALILAATELVQDSVGAEITLLVDDPAAELDRRSAGRLMEAVLGLNCQVFATALERDVLEFPAPPAVFHVEHGVLTAE